MTWGTATVFHSYSSYVYADHLSTSYNTEMNKVVTIYEDRDPNTLYYSTGEVSGSSITWETGTEFSTSNNDYPVIYYDSTAKRNIVAYYENDPQQGQVHVMKVEGVYSNMTADNFLGYADASIANAASGDVVVRGGTITTMGGASHITSASGGTITTDGDYKVHTFTSSGNFVVSTMANYPTVDILQIAGGGGGGRRRGGGGGAGGYLYETGVGITAGTYAVTVGAGGTGATSGNSSNGGNSSIGSLITASVGGGGGGGNAHGANGGSGGGSQGMTAGINAGLKTFGQGYDGVVGENLNRAGGGGGSSAMGGVIGGELNSGGAATTNSITVTSVVRAGGGGGWNAGSGGGGGASAGGSGSPAASNATANTGSGGGGSYTNGAGTVGGNGASGFVAIRVKV